MQYENRFKWLDARFFRADLRKALGEDAEALLGILQRSGAWRAEHDSKLDKLYELVARTHPEEKILIFTQFADTAMYLGGHLRQRGLRDLEVVTATTDATQIVRRFSPSTNGGLQEGESELRVLVATDTLAEGQNLQDAHIVVNYDLPWAIIRLIQRAGRVDRIGQKHDTIHVYSFWPAEGIEEIIRLRMRLSRRLQQNQEVIGSDESFFGEEAANYLRDLYTEKAGSLDDDHDTDVDLASIALQVWNSASEDDREAAQNLPPLIASARAAEGQPGVITYLRYPDGSDALVRVDESGEVISQSLITVFADAACGPDTPALPLAPNHYELVASAVRAVGQEQQLAGGHLGPPRSVRRKVYERMRLYRELLQKDMPLFAEETLKRLDPAVNAINMYPLTEAAQIAFRRQMRLGITDEGLAEMLVRWHEEGRLCAETEEVQRDPQIICSLGMVQSDA